MVSGGQPIGPGGRRREDVIIATAEQEQALAAYGQAAIDAFAEVETNLDLGNVVRQRLIYLKSADNESENALRIAQLRYREGEEDLLNVLTIQQRFVSAQSTRLSAERLLLEQRVNVNLALGGSWEE